MRILFYLHRFPAIGGIENVTAFLANSFAREGHVVEIISHVGVKGQEDAQVLDSRIRFQSMPESSCTSRSNRKFLFNHILAKKPNVIVFQDSYAPIERNLFPVPDNVPVVVCEHNAPYQGYIEPISWGTTLRSVARKALNPLRSRLRASNMVRRHRKLYEACWRYALLSDRYFGEFKAILQLKDARKLVAISNAVGSGPGKVRKKKNDVLFVGALNYRKGLDMLISSWGCIASRFPDWRLVIVGDGPMRGYLEKSVIESELHNVTITGSTIDPSEYFADAKIFAFPSRREGWPLVVQEAQAYGCVPVLFDSFSAAHDIVQDGDNGLLVPAFDTDAFARRLASLMNADSEIERMSLNAAAVICRYSPENIMQKWAALFAELPGNCGKE